jgi:hypothetical protein
MLGDGDSLDSHVALLLLSLAQCRRWPIQRRQFFE